MDKSHINPILKEWLGESGINWFREIKKEHGTINAVWMEGKIPYSVHFREGMQIRNKLRELIPDMGDHWYDDNWVEIIEETILL